MATSSLPVSSLVNVTVNLSAAPAQSQSLTNLLILGTSNVIDTNTRVRNYSTLTAVAADFGTTAPEYFAADEWFAQSPQPTTLSVGRWAQTATSGSLIGSLVPAANQVLAVWNAITNGGFEITIDGSTSIISGLNFSSATNLNGVASIITSGISGAVAVWNSIYQNFVITSNSTGTSSEVLFLTTNPAGGVTDISAMLGLTTSSSGAYSVAGIAAETALEAVVISDEQFGQQWYAVVVLGATDSDVLAIAPYIEGTNTKHAFGVTTQEAGVLTSTDTSNIAYKLKQLGLRKSVVQYSSSSAYAVVSLLARILTTDYNANNTVITLAYKQEPGVVAESINQTQLNNLIANNANVFVNYDNGTAIIQPGVTSSGDFVDTIFGADWLAIAIQNTLFNLLYTSPTKIPQTNAGNGVLAAGIIAELNQGISNG